MEKFLQCACMTFIFCFGSSCLHTPLLYFVKPSIHCIKMAVPFGCSFSNSQVEVNTSACLHSVNRQGDKHLLFSREHRVQPIPNTDMGQKQTEALLQQMLEGLPILGKTCCRQNKWFWKVGFMHCSLQSCKTQRCISFHCRPKRRQELQHRLMLMTWITSEALWWR